MSGTVHRCVSRRVHRCVSRTVHRCVSRAGHEDLDVAEALGEVGIQRGQFIQGAVSGTLLVTQHLRQEEWREGHLHHNALHAHVAHNTDSFFTKLRPEARVLSINFSCTTNSVPSKEMNPAEKRNSNTVSTTRVSVCVCVCVGGGGAQIWNCHASK